MNKPAHHPRVPVPPPLVFLAFLLTSLLLNLWVPLQVPWPPLTRAVGAMALAAGLLLAGLSVTLMRRAGTSPDPRQPSTVLVTDGPFRLSRNPIYLGFTLIVLGATLFGGTLWGVLLAPLLVAAITRLIIHPEEKYLHTRFKAPYAIYRSRVRQWL